MSAIAILGALGFTTRILQRYMTYLVQNENYPVFGEPPSTTIILPTYNEELFVKDTLDSLENQNIRKAYPDKFELLIVDNHSTDSTPDITQLYGKVIFAPKGKLTSRDIGIKQAKGEIIVAADADTYYPPNWLNLMLHHFQCSKCVAVSGPRLTRNPILLIGYVWNAFRDASRQRMVGSNSAFRKESYLASGGFNLQINQFNRHEMVQEEEFNFTQKLLSQGGNYIYDFQTAVFTSTRHWKCPFTHRLTSCDRICKYCEMIKQKERF